MNGHNDSPRVSRLMRAVCRLASLILLTIAGTATLAQAQHHAYVTIGPRNTVRVIDTATNTLVANIPVGSRPHAAAVSADDSRVYVTNSGDFFDLADDSVSVIDTGTNTVVATITVPHSPYGVAVTPDGALVYVTHFSTKMVSVISTATNTVVATIPVLDLPHGLAVTPDGARVYVAHEQNSKMSVIDTASNSVIANVQLDYHQVDVAVTSDGSRVYASSASSVVAIDTATNTVVATLPIPTSASYPGGIAVTPDGTRVYAVLGQQIAIFDTASNSLITTIQGDGPLGVSVTPDGKFVYVSNRDLPLGYVMVLDTSTNTVVATVTGDEFFPTAFGQFIRPNYAPTAVDDSYSASVDTPLTVAAPGVLGNDSDLNADSLEASVVSGPSHGTVASSPDGSFTYTPATGYTGSDAFTYKATDVYGLSAPATVSLTVATPTCGITVEPASIKQPYVAIPYLQTLSANPSQSYMFSVSAGALPPGLYLLAGQQSAVILGIPTTPGTFSFTVTAKKKNSPCAATRSYTVIIPTTVVPLLTCVQKIGNNTYRANFGYDNTTGAAVTIPVGAANYFTPGAQNRGQVTAFSPGTVTNAFTVTFTASKNDNDLAVWFVRGPDGQKRLLTVTKATFGCQ